MVQNFVCKKRKPPKSIKTLTRGRRTSFLFFVLLLVWARLLWPDWCVGPDALIEQDSSLGRRTQLWPHRPGAVQLQQLLHCHRGGKYNEEGAWEQGFCNGPFSVCTNGWPVIMSTNPIYLWWIRSPTFVLRNTMSVDSLASAPPLQYNSLTSSEVKEQLQINTLWKVWSNQGSMSIYSLLIMPPAKWPLVLFLCYIPLHGLQCIT